MAKSEKFGTLNSGGLSREDFDLAKSDLGNMLSWVAMLRGTPPGAETQKLITLLQDKFTETTESYHDSLEDRHRYKANIWTLRRHNPRFVAEVDEIMEGAKKIVDRMIENQARGISDKDLDTLRDIFGELVNVLKSA